MMSRCLLQVAELAVVCLLLAGSITLIWGAVAGGVLLIRWLLSAGGC